MDSREATSAPNRLRERRLERGLTQLELVRRSGVSRPQLWRLETGRMRPLRTTRMLLAAALGADEADLFPENGGEA